MALLKGLYTASSRRRTSRACSTNTASASRWTARARCINNVFIERLWRSLKYECVYLCTFASPREARCEVGGWITCYNHGRPHFSLDDRTPDEVYRDIRHLPQEA